MTRILIAEEPPASMEAVQQLFRQDGYDVRTIPTLQDVLRVAFRFQPHLILLGIAQSDTSAPELCAKLREFYDALIIVLGEMTSEADIVRVLESGADDFMSKTISAQELRARVHAHLRRPGARPGTGKLPYIDAELTIDLRRRRILKRGKVVILSPTEFELMSCLVEHRGEVVPHNKLLSEALGPHYRDDLRYLKVYIRRLREKLEDDPGQPIYLVTHRGIGYSFDPKH